MGHAHHFLQRVSERSSRSETDFALSLYRDAEMVHWILQYAHLPASAERAALAIDPEGRGPYIVVTRDGYFVTVLGAGMSTGQLPIVPRAQVDEFIARHTKTRAGLDYAKRVVPPGKKPVDVLGLLAKRPHDLSREEFLAITGFQPLIWAQALMDAFKATDELERSRPLLLGMSKRGLFAGPGSAKPREVILDMFRAACGIGPRFVLGAMGDLVWVKDVAASIGKDTFGFAFAATRERMASVARASPDRDRAGAPPGQARAQRSLQLREREEVQEVLREVSASRPTGKPA